MEKTSVGQVMSTLPNTNDFDLLCWARKSMKDGPGIVWSNLSMDIRVTLNVSDTSFLFLHFFSDILFLNFILNW
jgi:hypothetical protein